MPTSCSSSIISLDTSKNTQNSPLTDSGKVMIRVAGSVMKITEKSPSNTASSRFVQAATLDYSGEYKIDSIFHKIIGDSEELIRKDEISPSQRATWTRIRNRLMMLGITRLGDLTSISEKQLLGMEGVNRKAVYMLKSYLASFGLSLGLSIENTIYSKTHEITKIRLEPKGTGHPDYGLYIDENFNAPYGNTLFLKKLSSFPSALDSLQIRFLRNAGIVYFGDLVQKNEEEIKSIAGIGEKTFQLLQDLVHTNGMKFGCVELELWNVIRPSK